MKLMKKSCCRMLNPFGVRGGAGSPATTGFACAPIGSDFVSIGFTYGYSCSTTSWLSGQEGFRRCSPVSPSSIGFAYGYSRSTTSWLAGRSIGSAGSIGSTYGYSRLTTSWLGGTRKKMPGFTLMEQIVVLALTTVLVLIGFTAILNFQRLLMKVRENAGKDRSVYLFRNVLENDFRDSETIGWDGGLNIVKKTGGRETGGREMGTVRYQFEKLCVIRETAEAVDTFRFAASDVVISGVNGNDGLVEAISFKLSDDVQLYKMSFLKKYPDFKIWEVNAYGN